ncbi:hypothetical protein A2872_03540 [Candidatus Gottesmanbacteria bacterium RIFCSPHIGHO2_01_FULL_42_12]|uniref:Uncharacterized protein n=1 Tax=Candidatus Gottesmanbacteria bacterium RIFCSPHIGHO2_01_FULL_42_12 TaxID=1798377 RepID=A0A1F5Z4I9_9BACT|nr:MAG: hypothetical protein A2872_03540 [Candidatus Gottesmanbacteria bacterium RIFCSPHIGHO2_01_FULL_42_12]
MNLKKGNTLSVVIIIFLLFLTALSAFYLGLHRSDNNPVTKPISQGEVADWKTYSDKNYSFNYPANWIVEPLAPGGKSVTLAVHDSSSVITFSVRTEGNYDQITGKPFKDVYDYLKFPYKLNTRIVDGLEAIQALPRAGSENNFGVFLFSKDNSSVITLELDTPRDGSKIVEGEKLFDQILSTFKFLDDKEQISTVESVKLLPTNGWATADNKIFSLKYPDDKYRVSTSDNYIQLIPKTNVGDDRSNSPDFVVMNGYLGQSRRQYYLDMYSYYPTEVNFYEKLAGKINLLEVVSKGQTKATEILFTNGEKVLINAILNGADKQFVETVISTVKFN